jgi:hypothetical protein
MIAGLNKTAILTNCLHQPLARIKPGSQIRAAERSSGKGMPTYVLVGIPAAIICLLGGLVAYERHTEKAEERKRAENLKRWMESQGAPPPSGKPPSP